jgi:hypothetical protein
MTKTITRLYDHYHEAKAAVTDLERHGYTEDQISLIAHTGNQTNAEDGAGIGAGVGGVVGAGAGLLAGLGIMAIPGLGPVVAVGWLVSTAVVAVAGAAVGAAAGGLVGALTKEGVSEDDAHVYAEGIRRGGSLLTVRVPDERAAEAMRIMDEHSAIDPAARAEIYRTEGWDGFDENAPPYAPTPHLGAAQRDPFIGDRR